MLKWIDLEYVRESIRIETRKYGFWGDYGMRVPDFFLTFIRRKQWNQIFEE